MNAYYILPLTSFRTIFWIILLFVLLWPFSANAEKSFFELTLRAWHGDVEAQIELAEAFSLGNDELPQNQRKAIQWYQQAAQQGHLKAQMALGQIFEQPYGSFSDVNKALYWYKQAAAQGNSQAQERSTALTKLMAHNIFSVLNHPTPDPVKAHVLPSRQDESGAISSVKQTIPTTPTPPIASEVVNTQKTTIATSESIAITKPTGTSKPQEMALVLEQPNIETNQNSKMTPMPEIASSVETPVSASQLLIEAKHPVTEPEEKPSFLKDHGLAMVFTLGLPLALWLGLTFSNQQNFNSYLKKYKNWQLSLSATSSLIFKTLRKNRPKFMLNKSGKEPSKNNLEKKRRLIKLKIAKIQKKIKRQFN